MKIRNWEKFQHYQDREPKWIKIYRDLLNDVDWFELDDTSARFLVNLWLIAAETAQDGTLPAVRKIAFRLHMKETVVAQLLSKLSQWLVLDDTELYQPVPECTPERETETETDKRQKAVSFMGKVIRLNETDHTLWKQSFKHIDVDGALASRDAYLADTEDLTARKNWFVSTAAWLRNKNEEAKKANGKVKGYVTSPTPKPFKPSATDPPKPSEEERAKQIEKFLKVRTLPKVHRSSA